MRGLRTIKEHKKLSKYTNNDDVKIITFGLTENSARSRALDFVNAKSVIANFDNDSSKWGKGLWGINTFPPHTLLDFVSWNKVDCIVIMSDAFKEIAEQLDSMGLQYYCALYLKRELNVELDGLRIEQVEHNRELIEKNRDKISEARSYLSDEKSLAVLDGILETRRSTDLRQRYMINHKLYTPDRYYPKDVPGFTFGDEETFLDAGAAGGDTVLEFLDKVNYRYASILAFEPDPGNLLKLIEKTKYIPRVLLYSFGVFSGRARMTFQLLGSNSSKIIESEHTPNGTITINTVAVDDIVESPISFLKMDIEGAEVKALEGARETIKKYKPKLAICVYHKVTDLWEVPIIIHKIAPDYKLYMRHHTYSPNIRFNHTDTVLYGL